jgi:hypothetical protein
MLLHARPSTRDHRRDRVVVSPRRRALASMAPTLQLARGMVAKKKTSTKKTSTPKRTIKTPKTGAPRISKKSTAKKTGGAKRKSVVKK